MNPGGLDTDAVRIVGGELVSSTAADTSKVRVEVLRRKSDGPISWRFRQPKLALFWFRSGVERLHLEFGGAPLHSRVSAAANFALFPASCDIGGEFDVHPYCDYTVVFIDPQLYPENFLSRFQQPLVAFGHQDLQRSLPLLCREAVQPDSIFDLFAEGWAMQALAQLARMAGGTPEVRPWRGGLPSSTVRRLQEFAHANLARTITVDELAALAGVSRRHFLRAFQESLGQTPLRYVQGLRIDKAKQLLANPWRSVTEVGLECGFSHAQHFSSCFRKSTGVTPTAFRRGRALF